MVRHRQYSFSSLESSSSTPSSPSTSASSSDLTPPTKHYYPYQPLNLSEGEIRVILVTPSPNGHFNLSLHTVSLPSKPKYCALSYVWGDANDTTEIPIDGHVVTVTRSLALALREFSSAWASYESQYIWADALCIDQNDEDEKGHLVQYMGHIYSNAHEVVGWLGREDYRDAFKYIRKVALDLQTRARKGEPRYTTSWVRGYPKLIETHYEAGFTLTKSERAITKNLDVRFSPTGNYIWDNIGWLTCNEYWTRVWILQELCLCESSRTFLIAPGIVMRLDHLLIFTKWLIKIRNKDHERLRPAGMDKSLWARIVKLRSAFSRINMISNLRQTRTIDRKITPVHPLVYMGFFNCFDPRDRIFGMHSLLNMKMRVDYNQSVERTYTLAAEEMLTTAHLELIISGLGLGMPSHVRGNKNLPSWVPDWGVRQEVTEYDGYIMFPITDIGAGCRFDSEYLLDEVRWSARHGILTVHGILVDTILEVTRWKTPREFRAWVLRSTQPSSQRASSGTMRLQDIFYFMRFTGEPESEGHLIHVAAAFALFLALGHRWEEKVHKDRYQHDLEVRLLAIGIRHDASFEQDVRERILGQLSTSPSLHVSARQWFPPITRGDKEEAPMLLRYIIRAISRAALLETRYGALGLGPVGTAIGDKICIIRHIKSPFLLRMVRGKLRLVGRCRVEGWMNGEIFQHIDNGTAKFEDIKIA